jgi:site-specific DNA-methyltransferase (adenine-specific)
MKSEFLHADSIKVLADLPDQSIEVLITDPPYPNQQGLFPETISDGYAGLYLGAKKVKNYVVFFWSPRSLAPLPPPGWYEVARHIWAKPDATSITAYEQIVVWSRNYKRQRSKVWTVPILDFRTLSDWQPHPTQKPLKLMRYLLDLYTKEGDTVLDPFAGSGTTAVACLQTKRYYVAIEKDAKYAEAAKKRLEQKGFHEYELREQSTEPESVAPPKGVPSGPEEQKRKTAGKKS